jgi:hypothetical protein
MTTNMVNVRGERMPAWSPMFWASQYYAGNLNGLTYQDNQFDETLATHQHTDGEALPPKTMTPTRSHRTTNDLAEKGAKNNSNDVSPSLAIVKQTQVGVETRKSKIEREEQ